MKVRKRNVLTTISIDPSTKEQQFNKTCTVNLTRLDFNNYYEGKHSNKVNSRLRAKPDDPLGSTSSNKNGKQHDDCTILLQNSKLVARDENNRCRPEVVINNITEAKIKNHCNGIEDSSCGDSQKLILNKNMTKQINHKRRTVSKNALSECNHQQHLHQCVHVNRRKDPGLKENKIITSNYISKCKVNSVDKENMDSVDGKQKDKLQMKKMVNFKGTNKKITSTNAPNLKKALRKKSIKNYAELSLNESRQSPKNPPQPSDTTKKVPIYKTVVKEDIKTKPTSDLYEFDEIDEKAVKKKRQRKNKNLDDSKDSSLYDKNMKQIMHKLLNNVIKKKPHVKVKSNPTSVIPTHMTELRKIIDAGSNKRTISNKKTTQIRTASKKDTVKNLDKQAKLNSNVPVAMNKNKSNDNNNLRNNNIKQTYYNTRKQIDVFDKLKGANQCEIFKNNNKILIQDDNTDNNFKLNVNNNEIKNLKPNYNNTKKQVDDFDKLKEICHNKKNSNQCELITNDNKIHIEDESFDNNFNEDNFDDSYCSVFEEDSESFRPRPNANSTSRFVSDDIIRNPHFLHIKTNALPSANQEPILDHTLSLVFEKDNTNKIFERTSKSYQKSILDYVTSNNNNTPEISRKEKSKYSTFFDEGDLSPINENISTKKDLQPNNFLTPKKHKKILGVNKCISEISQKEKSKHSSFFDEGELSPIKENISPKKDLQLNPFLTPTKPKNILGANNRINIISMNLISTPLQEKTGNLEQSPNLSVIEKDKRLSYFGFDSLNSEEVLTKPTDSEPFRFSPLKQNHKIYGEKARTVKFAPQDIVVATEDNTDHIVETKVDSDFPSPIPDDESLKVGMFEDIIPAVKAVKKNYTVKKRLRRNYLGDYDMENDREYFKKKKKDQPTKAELEEQKKWEEQFNAMCKEVDKHELSLE